MRYFFLIIPFLFSLSLNANEINNDEFPLIKPVSVEKADIPVKKEVVEKTEEVIEKAEEVVEETQEIVSSDEDGDGVEDSLDECPGTQEGSVVNEAGCPQVVHLKINFEVDKYNISSEYLPKIEEFALFLEENPEYNVIIYGHTDITGSENHNEVLSKNRAHTVMDALVELGISETRLTAIGMSSKNPIADNETDEGLAQNRRIEVELIK